jgi:hypothetical protein
LPVRQSFVGARWCGWDDTQKGELGSKLIGSRNGLRQTEKSVAINIDRGFRAAAMSDMPN